LHEHGIKLTKDEKISQDNLRKVILVGNPNVGKSVIFSHLTGKYVTVSNYPGTTVEVSKGQATFKHHKYLIIDTPGTNSLVPMSEDEKVTRDILLAEKPDVVVQVSDAKNLRRTLVLAFQLAEMRIPFVLNLNMLDEANSRGISIDVQELSEILGVEVVETVAVQKRGIDNLITSLERPRFSNFNFQYGKPIEEGIRLITSLLPLSNIDKRSIALMILSGDSSLKDWLQTELGEEKVKTIEKIVQDIQAKHAEPLSFVISKERARQVGQIIFKVMHEKKVAKSSFAEIMGRLSMHPVWGIPILLVVLYLTYKFVGQFGAGISVDFLQNVVFGKFINVWSAKIVRFLIPIKLAQDFLVGEYGLITMALTYGFAIVLPIVTTFFIAFGILEDSGYLPRLAVMVDRVFGTMGLNGKAVLPMVLGLGCDTMATLTTRILETRKERILVTLLLALGVPCSAQLGVILGMIGTLSPLAMLLWSGTVLGVMILVGYLASKILAGERSEFILELPPIRVPQLSNIFIKTMARLEWYLKEVIPIFILATAFLFVFDKLHLLVVIRSLASPVVEGFLNLPPKATDAFLIGFLRRDYGAAGLFALAKAGQMSPIQIVVSLVTITLFVPCVANFFIIIKERGLKVALAIVSFIFPFAFLVGGILNFFLRALGVSL
jgi:ferrous iron transport protein B